MRYTPKAIFWMHASLSSVRILAHGCIGTYIFTRMHTMTRLQKVLWIRIQVNVLGATIDDGIGGWSVTVLEACRAGNGSWRSHLASIRVKSTADEGGRRSEPGSWSTMSLETIPRRKIDNLSLIQTSLPAEQSSTKVSYLLHTFVQNPSQTTCGSAGAVIASLTWRRFDDDDTTRGSPSFDRLKVPLNRVFHFFFFS